MLVGVSSTRVASLGKGKMTPQGCVIDLGKATTSAEAFAVINARLAQEAQHQTDVLPPEASAELPPE